MESLEIPDEGLKIHLRGYGWVMVFKFVAKNGHIDYITTNMKNSTREQIKKITLYQQTWKVIKTAIQHNIRWLLADMQFC